MCRARSVGGRRCTCTYGETARAGERSCYNRREIRQQRQRSFTGRTAAAPEPFDLDAAIEAIEPLEPVYDPEPEPEPEQPADKDVADLIERYGPATAAPAAVDPGPAPDISPAAAAVLAATADGDMSPLLSLDRAERAEVADYARWQYRGQANQVQQRIHEMGLMNVTDLTDDAPLPVGDRTIAVPGIACGQISEADAAAYTDTLTRAGRHLSTAAYARALDEFEDTYGFTGSAEQIGADRYWQQAAPELQAAEDAAARIAAGRIDPDSPLFVNGRVSRAQADQIADTISSELDDFQPGGLVYNFNYHKGVRNDPHTLRVADADEFIDYALAEPERLRNEHHTYLATWHGEQFAKKTHGQFEGCVRAAAVAEIAAASPRAVADTRHYAIAEDSTGVAESQHRAAMSKFPASLMDAAYERHGAAVITCRSGARGSFSAIPTYSRYEHGTYEELIPVGKGVTSRLSTMMYAESLAAGAVNLDDTAPATAEGRAHLEEQGRKFTEFYATWRGEDTPDWTPRVVSITTSDGPRLALGTGVFSARNRIADDAVPGVAMITDGTEATSVHEVAHTTEAIPAVHVACRTFLSRRTAGLEPHDLGGPNSGEMGVGDSFVHAYVGRIYADRKCNTEVFSVGAEMITADTGDSYAEMVATPAGRTWAGASLLTDPTGDGTAIRSADPDHRDLTIGLLSATGGPAERN